jgi:hypothetical protein
MNTEKLTKTEELALWFLIGAIIAIIFIYVLHQVSIVDMSANQFREKLKPGWNKK